MKNSILLLIFSLVATISFAQESYTTEQYIETYADWAVEEMQHSGVPACITLGQGILESGSGNSRLAREANNHFGIKCHSDWTGEKVYHDDDASQECFRKYKSAYESFNDHS
ncbi:MAG: glucosaminidase domain-containing protein, partial [Bacteroidota bacterium]|nr:glucosaminidase domain-containing protein [Bacteroidota bacterium]